MTESIEAIMNESYAIGIEPVSHIHPNDYIHTFARAASSIGTEVAVPVESSLFDF